MTTPGTGVSLPDRLLDGEKGDLASPATVPDAARRQGAGIRVAAEGGGWVGDSDDGRTVPGDGVADAAGPWLPAGAGPCWPRSISRLAAMATTAAAAASGASTRRTFLADRIRVVVSPRRASVRSQASGLAV